MSKLLGIKAGKELLSDLYNYVGDTAKRVEALAQLQELFKEPKLRLLNLCGTRWLSR